MPGIATQTTSRRTVTLTVDGMTCGSCEARIRGALAALPGATTAQIDRPAGRVTVETTHRPGDDRVIAEAITAAGYPARLT